LIRHCDRPEENAMTAHADAPSVTSRSAFPALLEDGRSARLPGAWLIGVIAAGRRSAGATVSHPPHGHNAYRDGFRLELERRMLGQ
jgi:hypothetical protein